MSSPRLEEYERFDVAQEPWCKYRLDDGTMLRARFVLLKVSKIYSGVNPAGANITAQTLIVTEVPKKNHGPPGRPLPVPELQKFVVKDNLGFRPLEERPSVYLLEDGRVLQAQVRLAKVARSSVFDLEGQPQYLVTHNQLLTVSGGPQAAPEPMLSTSQPLPGSPRSLPSPSPQVEESGERRRSRSKKKEGEKK